MDKTCSLATILAVGLCYAAMAQTPAQPKVAPGPNEPDWAVILKDRYGLSMFGDLVNPVRTEPKDAAGLFRKAGAGPVRYRPVIALGLETKTRGGWYTPPGAPGSAPRKTELWSYVFKNTTEDLKTGKNLPPPLAGGSSTDFDPGEATFGVWASNDQFDDGGVFTQPGVVAAVNRRLARQPYKAMIYPNRDKATGRIIPNSYLIGWEYSTNDDFQDVVCQLDNAILIDEGRSEK
jgi:hypothetical protein